MLQVVVESLTGEMPRCPEHPGCFLRPVDGVPLVGECFKGCQVALVVPDARLREALVAVWYDALGEIQGGAPPAGASAFGR